MPKPFSIVRRLAVMAAAVSALALLLNALLLVTTVGPVMDDLARSMAQHIVGIRLALQQAGPASRDTLAETLTRAGPSVYRARPDELASAATDPWLASGCSRQESAPDGSSRVRQLLRAELPPEVSVRFDCIVDEAQDAPALQQVRAMFEVHGERWHVDLPSSRPPLGGPISRLVASLALVALAAVAMVAMGARLIARPIANIARQISCLRVELTPLEMKDGVGTELQTIVSSFNRLVKALNREGDARRHMLAGLSHDLRTPLARLRLRTECECQCDEATAKALASDFDSLSRIVDQFLTYAQGGGGASPGRAEPLDELVTHIAQAYSARGVTLSMDHTAASRLAYPDLAVQRLLSNLVDNALAHGQAPVSIHIDLGGSECLVTVRDGGRGISESALPQALMPFVKLPDAGASLSHCGLGLAIVEQIAAQMGGRVVSAPFDGTGWSIGVALPMLHGGASESA